MRAYKCQSKIRQSIRESGDFVHADLGQHKVKDRYHVMQCFDCQSFDTWVAVIIVIIVRSVMPSQRVSTVQVPANRKIVRGKRRVADLISGVRTVATVN